MCVTLMRNTKYNESSPYLQQNRNRKNRGMYAVKFKPN